MNSSTKMKIIVDKVSLLVNEWYNENNITVTRNQHINLCNKFLKLVVFILQLEQ